MTIQIRSDGSSAADKDVPTIRYHYDGHRGLFRATRSSRSERFVRGPIPFDWMKKANRLPGKAGAVAFALWFLKGVKGSNTFTLTQEFDELTGCGRKAIYAGLRALEAANLIRAVPREGGRPEITMLITDSDDT